MLNHHQHTVSEAENGVHDINVLDFDGDIDILAGSESAPCFTWFESGLFEPVQVQESSTFIVQNIANDEDEDQTLEYGIAGGDDANLFTVDNLGPVNTIFVVSAEIHGVGCAAERA